MEFRALSDKWQFRRKQKKWSRRKDSKLSSPKETVFSSTEDLLDDDIPKDHTPTNLMMVSELRKSLTGLDRAVKTYSFMMTEDHVPVIQVERASIDTVQMQKKSLLQMSSACSSFESDEDLHWDTVPCPNGGMDNFATGIMDTFESNLLKLRGFQTQSLPDVFEATKHFVDDGSSDASALSSASTSVASILDATDVLLDHARSSPSGGSHAVYPATSPLTLTHNGTISPKMGKEFEEDDSCLRNRDDARKRRPDRVSSAGSCRTWGSNSPMGSDGSERGAPSPQPLAMERLKFPIGSSGSVVVNGVDSPSHQRESSFDEVPSKRISKISVTSSKYEDPTK